MFFLSHMSINEDLLVLIYLQVASNKVGQQIDSWSEFNLDSDEDSDVSPNISRSSGKGRANNERR